MMGDDYDLGGHDEAYRYVINIGARVVADLCRERAERIGGCIERDVRCDHSGGNGSRWQRDTGCVGIRPENKRRRKVQIEDDCQETRTRRKGAFEVTLGGPLE